MSLRNVPSQNSFLYDETWTAETDSFFLRLLVEQKSEGNWISDHANCHALNHAKELMEKKFKLDFSWDDVYGRSLKLKKRYETFKFVKDREGVWWDRMANKVYAETTVWREIVKENSFALAYYHCSEPEMEKLTTLYAPEDHHMPRKPVEIVEISDGSLPQTTVRDHVSRTTILVSDDDDEVASPVVNKKKTRNAFYPPDFFVKAPKIGSSSKMKAPKNAPTGSSSCDSFSPLKSFYFPDKSN